MNKKFIRYYTCYEEIVKSLKNKTYNLCDDSIGQYNRDGYSADITVRDYDGEWCIDFDVYDLDLYLDGGKICNVNDMPETDEAFWKLIASKVEEYIRRIRNE